ncbi:MAG: methyltransferase domain-containing protein [Bacteroidales bacterium]|jgi:SAM-dependent methyltransferase|nr:methyltransferase domain-containing protein [Bacteroidales bacterium]
MNRLKENLKRLIPIWLGKKIRGTFQKFLGLIYIGKKYHCPYCKFNFRKMLSDGETHAVIAEYQIIGSGYRENCKCPRCYAKDRDRLIHLYLEKNTSIFTKNHRVLNIAPEAWLKEFFQSLSHIHYTYGVKGVENMGYYYDRTTRELDITNLEMKDNLYDTIVCNHVLEHIHDDVAAMKEIYRVLKPGGWAILQVPYSASLEETFEERNINTSAEREKLYGQFDHVRIYGLDYFKRLEFVGFNVERFNPINEDWGKEYIEKYALNPREDLCIAHKPL